MTLSYLEIYNERINDLLQPSSTDLQLSEDPVRGMVVQGITEYGADSADEILELLHRGNLHRTASTLVEKFEQLRVYGINALA